MTDQERQQVPAYQESRAAVDAANAAIKQAFAENVNPNSHRMRRLKEQRREAFRQHNAVCQQYPVFRAHPSEDVLDAEDIVEGGMWQCHICETINDEEDHRCASCRSWRR